jgi:drug/metabolite transporter (DMT)-like permease
MHSRSSLISGLGFALAACALWGAIFLVPAMLPEFSPLQITFGRFVLYGVVALCVFCLGPPGCCPGCKRPISGIWSGWP